MKHYLATYFILFVIIISCAESPIDKNDLSQNLDNTTILSKSSRQFNENLVVENDLINYANYKQLMANSTGSESKVVDITPYEIDGDILMYIINYEEGWEIISADKRTVNVLANSNNGYLSIEECPDAILL